jgi:hypothetical protein
MAKSNRFSGALVAIVLIALAGGGYWYYLRNKGDAKPEYTMVKTSRGDLVQTVTATGDLQPVVTVDIGAQVSGLIKDVLVDYNSVVKAGDVLARIDESTRLSGSSNRRRTSLRPKPTTSSPSLTPSAPASCSPRSSFPSRNSTAPRPNCRSLTRLSCSARLPLRTPSSTCRAARSPPPSTASCSTGRLTKAAR